MVLMPVIVAYLMTLFTGTSAREGRKRFFYACVVNNISLVGMTIAIFVLLFYGQYFINVYEQPDWAPIAQIYKANL